jgi:hypothetical protein
MDSTCLGRGSAESRQVSPTSIQGRTGTRLSLSEPSHAGLVQAQGTAPHPRPSHPSHRSHPHLPHTEVQLTLQVRPGPARARLRYRSPLHSARVLPPHFPPGSFSLLPSFFPSSILLYANFSSTSSSTSFLSLSLSLVSFTAISVSRHSFRDHYILSAAERTSVQLLFSSHSLPLLTRLGRHTTLYATSPSRTNTPPYPFPRDQDHTP